MELTIHFWSNLAAILDIFAFSFNTVSWLNEKRNKAMARKLELLAAGILLTSLAISALVVKDYSFWTWLEAGWFLMTLVGVANMRLFGRWLHEVMFNLTEVKID